MFLLSWKNDTVGMGVPLTRHFKCSSWPSTAVTSCMVSMKIGGDRIWAGDGWRVDVPSGLWTSLCAGSVRNNQKSCLKMVQELIVTVILQHTWNKIVSNEHATRLSRTRSNVESFTTWIVYKRERERNFRAAFIILPAGICKTMMDEEKKIWLSLKTMWTLTQKKGDLQHFAFFHQLTLPLYQMKTALNPMMKQKF